MGRPWRCPVRTARLPRVALLFLLLVCPYTVLCQTVAVVGSLPSYDITTRLGQGENPVPPGIEWLGAGYDVVYGNPSDHASHELLDPGFRQNLIVQFFDARRTSGAYQEPVGVSIRRAPVCKYDTRATEIDSIQTYQSFLALDLTIGAGIPILAPKLKRPEMLKAQSSSSSGVSSSSSSSSSGGSRSSVDDLTPLVAAANGSTALGSMSMQQVADPIVFDDSAVPTLIDESITQVSGVGGSSGLSLPSAPSPAITFNPTLIPTVPSVTVPSIATAAASFDSSSPSAVTQSNLAGTAGLGGPGKGGAGGSGKGGGVGVGYPLPLIAEEAFVLSAGWFRASAALQASETVTFFSRAVCVEYIAEFRSFLAPLLTDNFLAGIAYLPDTYPPDSDESERAWSQRAAFTAFIAEFGTHYTHRLVVGGKRVVQAVAQAAQVATLQSEGVDVAFGAAFAPGFFGAAAPAINGSFGVNAQAAAFSQLDQAVSERTETTIGGLPETNYYAWIASIPDRAIPIQYTVKPLPELLDGPKRLALQLAIEAYIAAAKRISTGLDG